MSTISRPIMDPLVDVRMYISNFDIDDRGDAWSDTHANFLSSLSKEEKQNLIKHSRRLILKSRDHMFRTGGCSNDVYIIANGCIRLLQVSSTGKETILGFCFTGEIFGMAEVWQRRDRQIYAVANEATQVYSIQRSDFISFLGAHPKAAMKAIGILSARIRALGHVLVGRTCDNVQTRIARLLLRFASVSSGIRCCADSNNNNELCVNVRLTHQDIADLIGASRQTVTTTLVQFRKRGTVRIINQHIHIVRSDHLCRLIELGAAKVCS